MSSAEALLVYGLLFGVGAVHTWVTACAWRAADRPAPRAAVVAAGVLSFVPILAAVVFVHSILASGVGPIGVAASLALAALLVAVYLGVAWVGVRWVGRAGGAWLVGAGVALAAFALVSVFASFPVPFGPFGSPVGAAAFFVLLLVAFSGAPLAVARWASEGGRAWVGVGLVLAVLVPTSLVAGVGAMLEAERGPAEQLWRVEVAPSGPEPYVLVVPFPVLFDAGTAPERAGVLASFRDAVRVVDGAAEIAWRENGSLLAISARGPVVVEGHHVFFGDVHVRESFNAYTLATSDVTRSEEGPPQLDVVWTIDLSGGGGHTCWASESYELGLAPGETRPLRDRVTDEGLGDDRPWGTVCA